MASHPSQHTQSHLRTETASASEQELLFLVLLLRSSKTGVPAEDPEPSVRKMKTLIVSAAVWVKAVGDRKDQPLTALGAPAEFLLKPSHTPAAASNIIWPSHSNETISTHQSLTQDNRVPRGRYQGAWSCSEWGTILSTPGVQNCTPAERASISGY